MLIFVWIKHLKKLIAGGFDFYHNRSNVTVKPKVLDRVEQHLCQVFFFCAPADKVPF